MNNIEPSPKEKASELINLEIAWSRLNWFQRKTMRLKIHIVLLIIHHITEAELLRARIERRINRLVLYHIFPAHWLKD